MKRAGDILYQAAIWTVRLTGSLIFAWLIWHSLRYTYFCVPGQEEISVLVEDTVWKQIAFLLLFFGCWLLLSFLEKKAGRNASQLISGLSVMAACGWVAAAGFYWVLAAEHIPDGDPAFIYGGASYFLEGDFKFLNTPGGYFAVYPHQLPLTALTEALFAVIGPYRYRAVQCINVALAAAAVFLGYLIVREFTDSLAAAVMYNVTAACCLPLIFYTGWVYGEMPGLLFALMGAWLLLRYEKSGRTGYLAGVAAAVTLAVTVRKNSLILVIALCLVALVQGIARRDKKLLAAAVCTILLPFVIYRGVYAFYERRSGYEHSKGMPAITWVSMGLNENNGMCGWYDNSGKRMYIDSGYDREKTKAAAAENIRSRLAVFRADKMYAKRFLREKIMSQWNAPLYQSLYFNSKYREDMQPEETSLAAKLSAEYFPGVLSLANRLQLAVYAGMLCYFLFGVKKGSDIRQHFAGIAVLGGFFFSVLWEAKARYVFPYYVMMFPYASVGIRQVLAGIRAAGGKQADKKPEEDNVIPFPKSA